MLLSQSLSASSQTSEAPGDVVESVSSQSPSFSVSAQPPVYYCFGCQASGNALKFLMEFDRVDFVGAVEHDTLGQLDLQA